jgi:hypothetical protein
MPSSDDEFDAFRNEFDGIDFDAIPALSLIANNDESSQNSLETTRSNASSEYSCDEFDASFIAELDEFEERFYGEAGVRVQGS